MNNLLYQIHRPSASAFTHSGKFHADDVFSAALLLYLNPEIMITRGGASHVGIYIGNGQMVHSGNPNKISDIYNSYYQQHWMCVARW